MPDDHSEVVPLLPIPNRTVKRFSADDSAGSRVKVGHRQAINEKAPVEFDGSFFSCATGGCAHSEVDGRRLAAPPMTR